MTNTNENKTKYSLGEICRETVKEMRDSAPGVFLEALIGSATCPFYLATAAKRFREDKSVSSSASQEIAGALGTLGGFAATYFLTHAAYSKGYVGEYLAALAATNAISWGYEKVRKAKKNLDEKYNVQGGK